jgi:hypothetical protein
MKKVEKIWMDGTLVNWDDAQVHVLTHTLHYGLGVFRASGVTSAMMDPLPCSGSKSI